MIVDDGIATGSTARAACRVTRAQGAGRVVLAVPVCSPDAAPALRGEIDELVYLEGPRRFHREPVLRGLPSDPDDEVAALLQAARRRPTAAGAHSTLDRAEHPAVDEADGAAGRARLAASERARPPDSERPVHDSTRMRNTPS